MGGTYLSGIWFEYRNRRVIEKGNSYHGYTFSLFVNEILKPICTSLNERPISIEECFAKVAYCDGIISSYPLF